MLDIKAVGAGRGISPEIGDTKTRHGVANRLTDRSNVKPCCQLTQTLRTTETPKMTFGFRLKFDMPPGREFAGAAPRRRLHLGEMTGRIYLHRLPKPRKFRLGVRTRFAAVGKSFASEAEATDVGRRIQIAFAFFAAERQLGIDIQDRGGSSVSQSIKDSIAKEHGVHIRDDVHGLDVYSESHPVQRFGAEGYFSVNVRIVNYEERLQAYFAKPLRLTDKQALALSLYNASHFDSASRSRFLTLVTVVEILADRKIRSSQERTLLQSFKTQCKEADLALADRQSLLNALGNIVKRSIGDACAALIATQGSAADATYFRACYKARSELVHTGHTSSSEPLDPTKLDALVARVLVRTIAGEV